MVDVARWRTGPTVQIAHVASILGRSWILVPVAAATGWALRRGGRGRVPLWSVLVAIAAQNIIKEIVRRPRPPVRHLEHVTSWSFPSGHATEATALFVALAVAAWPLIGARWARGAATAAALGISLVVATARVVLGVHYPTDVAAGVVLGMISAALAFVCARRTTDARLGKRPAVTGGYP
jgi:undecaprenyl-diphosphatase